ncbi:hypothetical protein KGD83_17050 [Nocardiopsis akebiae]|uniref:DNA-binding protein n=1 Tax=Nocardiopsis akebiae TaxID=2831968 RepID=A0ABX8BYA5_9ACTN|nr:hypothetical protein [Nocardiopsis akebiae]QUX27054.1 hypothetical protein KGD83_17050 [Nocardiopsis akebiae]
MTTLSQLREAALALPEAEEDTRFGTVAFSVRGGDFASATGDGRVLLHLPDAEVEAALSAHPTGERWERAGTPVGFCVPLADVNGKELNALVRRAWLSRAPRRLAEAAEAAASAVPGEVGDLPRAIGAPATRALAEEGLTTLERVAALTEAELGALHGVGPKAVRILREALAERGLSPR